MIKFVKQRTALTLAFALLAVLGVAGVSHSETFKKAHSSIQRVFTSVPLATFGVNDFTDATSGTSATIDLSGGDFDKCSFVVVGSSANGTGTMTLTLQMSPDGSTWVNSGDTIAVATSTTLGAALAGTQAEDLKVSPGIKARLLMGITGSTTYYSTKIWAIPSVD